jgi:hypothetical protein
VHVLDHRAAHGGAHEGPAGGVLAFEQLPAVHHHMPVRVDEGEQGIIGIGIVQVAQDAAAKLRRGSRVAHQRQAGGDLHVAPARRHVAVQPFGEARGGGVQHGELVRLHPARGGIARQQAGGQRGKQGDATKGSGKDEAKGRV